MSLFSDCLCVGMHFRPPLAREICSTLEVGAELSLEREPENPHDPNAIKVIYTLEGEPIHIGYIERDKAIFIADDLDAIVEVGRGDEVTTTITGFLSKGRNLHPVLSIELPDA